MKKILFILALLGMQCALNAEIQDGRVVAGEIVIRNYSLRSVKVNGYEIKGGNALFLWPEIKKARLQNLKIHKLITGDINEQHRITVQKDLDRLFNAQNSFVFSASNGDQLLDIPLVDHTRESIPFGSKFNQPFLIGCDAKSEALEFDIVIRPKWLFGQSIHIGERFKQAQAAYAQSISQDKQMK